MLTFTVLPILVVIGFISVTLYKHFYKKNRQDMKASFLFVFFFSAIWGGLYYLVFS
ncbi:hypothetical protein SAMN05421825_2211 [Epilithonimonas hungarica]|uniref:Uncharacterized protein n=1 Tax=Epilithonimonas hungarica TaxID=454006 RepID=A0A1G7P943_9FLAO|nr:hypothetical protein SAMN05421825_2211 [Epilithonimonas hungarica]